MNNLNSFKVLLDTIHLKKSLQIVDNQKILQTCSCYALIVNRDFGIQIYPVLNQIGVKTILIKKSLRKVPYVCLNAIVVQIINNEGCFFN